MENTTAAIAIRYRTPCIHCGYLLAQHYGEQAFCPQQDMLVETFAAGEPVCTCTQRLYGVNHGVNCPLREHEYEKA